MMEKCDNCGENCKGRYSSGTIDGHVIFCSLKCSKKWITEHWEEFVLNEENFE
jgi:hypothetical protein